MGDTVNKNFKDTDVKVKATISWLRIRSVGGFHLHDNKGPSSGITLNFLTV